MKWFQHSTDSHDDPDISDAEDLFRDAGYNIFFKTLEIYGREFNSINNDGWLSISVTFFRRKLRKSATKVEQVLNFYQQRGRILYKIEGETISIKVPKFLKQSDNWTKRNPKEKDTKLCSNSVAPTAKEEKKKRIEKKKNKSKVDYPIWLNMELWNEFKNHRTLVKSPMSEHAEKLCLADLKKLVAEGEDPDACINQTIKSLHSELQLILIVRFLIESH